MKERPILFSAPMVRALLDGSKTQTRRVVKDRHLDASPPVAFYQYLRENSPFGKQGDKLWVREAWAARLDQDHLSPSQLKAGQSVGYWADGPSKCCNTGCAGGAGKKRPSIHMPRWASRILLEIVSVLVERLQDISEEDAEAEGIEGINQPTGGDDYQDYWRNYGVSEKQADGWPWFAGDQIASYKSLWESINGPGSWDANPWVWVIEFKLVKP